jgi:hypothetical protein
MGLVDANGNPDRKRINEVESYFRGREMDQKQVERNAHDKEEKDIGDLFVKRDYTAVKKALQNPDSKLTGDERRGWSEVVDRKLKRTDDDIGKHEDASEYLRINEMMDTDSDPKDIKKAILSSEHMKTTTQEKLLDRLDRKKDKDEAGGMSRANKYLRSQIAPSKGLMGASVPEEEARAAVAQQDLLEWVGTQRNLAATGKRDALTQREIFEHAQQMTPHYQMSMDEKIGSMTKQFQKKDSKQPQQDSPLKGKPAGRYRVDGRLVLWDGNKEL